MHAVIVRVEIDADRGDEAEKHLRETIVPMAKSLEGFVRGLWMRSSDGGTGRGVIVFDSEEHARAAAQGVEQAAAEAPVTFQGTEVVKVVAEA